MAAFDLVQNMHDVFLKPRLLRSFIKELLPDEKQQLGNPLELSQIVSAIKTHELLSERAVQTGDNKKLIEKWKSAVDLWVDRLLMLVSSNMPDKCWAGICLLGVTCEECSADRFLASYSVWFQKLLSHLQPPTESHFVKVACCVSLSDLLTRLCKFPNMKKDGTSQAGKLIQPVLKLIQDESSVAVEAVRLLCTIFNAFPSSIQKNYDSAESAIVTKLIYGKCNANLLKELALCLSLLPKSKGDEDSWCLMVQKILIAINILLNDSFQGLEDEAKSSEIMRELVPPGKDPPAPLGGLTVFDFSNKSTERLSMPNISTLMLCCSTMLTTSYPVQVRVPIRPLFMLIERVLNVDGSLPQTMYPTLTAMQQEYVCTHLPALHSYSLDILSDIIKKAQGQILMHGAHLIRIVTGYLRSCELPELRIKLYSLIKLMLFSMGVGLTMFISEDIINNASIDLDSIIDQGSEAQNMNKKRKHGENQSQTIHRKQMPISVKIAALEALETLLTMGGASRSERWRSNVDQLLMTVATDACNNGWTRQANDVNTPSWGDFQLASLKALLASLLSPGRFRPPFVAQGLELFRSGMQETGTKLAEFCAHALLALEVLIHPRALPLIDIASSVEFSFDNGMNDKFIGAQKGNVLTGGTSRNEAESEEDDLYEKWVKDGEINGIEKSTTEKVDSIEAPMKVPEDKGKGVMVETQETDRYVPENMEIEVAAVKDVSGGGAASDVAAKSGTVVGSEGDREFVFAFGGGDGDDGGGMDEIPDIVDVEPDSDED